MEQTGTLEGLAPGTWDILIAIPTRREADTLEETVRTIVEDLSSFNGRVTLLLCDNRSADKTRRIFRHFETPGFERFCLVTRKAGKGNSVRSALKIAIQAQPKALVIVPSIGRRLRGWVPALVEPLLHGEKQFSFPAVTSHPYAAPFGQQLALPAVESLTGWSMVQPLAGMAGMTPQVADFLLKKPWIASDRGYGVNVLMPLRALQGRFHAIQVAPPPGADLPALVHPNEAVFHDLTHSLFNTLDELIVEKTWPRMLECKGDPEIPATQDGVFDYKLIKKNAIHLFRLRREQIQEVLAGPTAWLVTKQFDQGRIDMNMSIWLKVVSACFRHYRYVVEDRDRIPGVLFPLFLARHLTFYRHSLELSLSDCRRLLETQRTLFSKYRIYFDQDPESLPPEKRPWYKQIRAAVL